jgi:O-antigen/teichoic acid export membrane protein
MIARFCGAEQLGFYALGFSVLVLIDLILQAFVSAPFSIFSQRAVKHRLACYTGDALAQAMIVGIVGIIVFVVLGIVATIAGSPVLSRVMFVLSMSVGFCVLREFARRHCFASGRLGLALIFDTLFSVVQLGGMYAMQQFQTLTSVTAHAAGGLACAAAVCVWVVIARNSLQFRSNRWRLHLRRHWHFGRWVFVSQATNQLNWNIVQWIIAVRLSTEATGVFTGCLTIAFLSNPFVLGIANLIYPRLALTRTQQGKQAMQRVALATAGMIAIVMCIFSIVLLIGGQSVCDTLYADSAYSNISVLLASLAAAVSCLAITMPIDGCLWAEQRTDLSSAASGVGLAITTIAVLILVPWGTTATAIGLLIGCIAESAARILFFFQCRQLTVIRTDVAAYAS